MANVMHNVNYFLKQANLYPPIAGHLWQSIMIIIIHL